MSCLKDSTVLITGGAGMIGSTIAAMLLRDPQDRPSEIRVVDNFVRGRRDNIPGDPSIRLIEGDIRDPAALASATAGCDYVFHQAAIRITLCAQTPRDCIDVLVGGTFNVFEAAASAGVKKIVYASSASVYGGAETYPTHERHHPYNNRTLYGAAKQMNEGIARHFADMNDLKSVGLRYFNVYGPKMDVTGAYTEVFVRWMDCIDRNERPQIHGDGSTSMDFVFVEDVARANLLAMKSSRHDEVYNIASGTETTLLGLWRAMQRVTGATQLEPDFQPARKVNPVPRRLADTRKARRDLGFESSVDLDEGLRRFIAWRGDVLRAKPQAAAV
ncbi:NAD-dependent epimerase/dehydratase family protein [soil metagenome]